MIEIDSRKGGNGDIWMRLVSLYVVAGIVPSTVRIKIAVPSFFVRLAFHIFGDRLEIGKDEPGKKALIYTSLGIKDILPKAFLGYRFISPYGKMVLHKKGNNGKRAIGSAVYAIADMLGLIQSPSPVMDNVYQGYQEIVAIKSFRNISYGDYCRQLQKDFHSLQFKSMHNILVSDSLKIPSNLSSNFLVFPTGTARQFVPVWWAEKFLPGAYYAFFYKDKMAGDFIKEGLKVIYFYEEPGDIIELSKHALHTISTDSFPSHLLQYATDNCTITITEVSKSNVISPSFRGKVVDATAPCHPCLHLDRGNHPLCEAGHAECINWKSSAYTNDILKCISE